MLNAASLISRLGNHTDLQVIYNWLAFGKIHHYLNISNCLSVKISVRTKAYIYYNSVVPSALWQRIKWIFTYDKMELLKWTVYGGKTELFTWMGLKFILFYNFILTVAQRRSWKMLPFPPSKLLFVWKMFTGAEKAWLLLLS